MAAATGLVSVDELAEGAFDAGPGGVEPSPLVPFCLVGAVSGLKSVQAAGGSSPCGAGASCAGGPAGAWVAPVWGTGPRCRGHGRWFDPGSAGLAVGTGDLAVVEVDGRVVPGEAGPFRALPCSADLDRTDGFGLVVAVGTVQQIFP